MDRTIEDYKNEIDLLKTYKKVLIEKLLQLQSTYPKWISVEERLPEEKMAVLVYGQRRVFNGKKIETFPMVHVAFLDEGWFAWDSEDVIEVTHWMSLPNGPKEDA